jgi:hypothetical protein
MKEGKCHLCGESTSLSFEHLPPRSALNDKKIELMGMMDWLKRNEPGKRKGKQYQRGFGAETLCRACNSNTGTWYVPHFSQLVLTGQRMLHDLPREQVLAANQMKDVRMYMDIGIEGVRPLAVIKQIATMFLALNNNNFRERHQPLADFVLNKEATGIPGDYQFHLMFYIGPFTRYSPLEWHVIANAPGPQSISELAVPPFCYVLTIENKFCIPYGSINHFADYKYEESTTLKMRVPIFYGNTPHVLDFRTLAEVEEQRKKSEAVSRS